MFLFGNERTLGRVERTKKMMDGNNCPSCFIAMKNKRIRLEKRRERSSSLLKDDLGLWRPMCFRTRPIHSSNCTWDQFEINTEVLAPRKPRSYQHCDFTSCEEKRKAQVCSLTLFWVSLLLTLVLTGGCSLSLFWVNLLLILVLGQLAAK